MRMHICKYPLRAHEGRNMSRKKNEVLQQQGAACRTLAAAVGCRVAANSATQVMRRILKHRLRLEKK
jgi:hypothetical protein